MMQIQSINQKNKYTLLTNKVRFLCAKIQDTMYMQISMISNAPTLNQVAALLGQSQVLLTQQIDGLVLVNLHAGAHVTVSMYEEREGAGQVLTAKEEEQMEDYSRVWSYSLRESSTHPGGLWKWCVDSWGLHSVFTGLLTGELQWMTEPWPGVLWKVLGNTRTLDTWV